jgi:hypothetical protein
MGEAPLFGKGRMFGQRQGQGKGGCLRARGNSTAPGSDFCEHLQRNRQLHERAPSRLLHSVAKFCHFAGPLIQSQLLGKGIPGARFAPGQ